MIPVRPAIHDRVAGRSCWSRALVRGFAVGGEMGPSTMFMLEAAPPGRRIFYASWQLASQNLGSLAYGLIGVFAGPHSFQAEPERLGLAHPLRARHPHCADRHLHSQPARRDAGARPNVVPAHAGAVVSIVLKDYWFSVLLGVALIAGGTITQYFLINMTPYAIRTLHLPDAAAMLGSISVGLTGAPAP